MKRAAEAAGEESSRGSRWEGRERQQMRRAAEAAGGKQQRHQRGREHLVSLFSKHGIRVAGHSAGEETH